MPHFWGNTLVVTKDELVPKYYNTLNTLKSQISRYKDKPYGVKKVWSGGNGRQMLISFDSLPKEIQDSLGDPRKLEHPLLKYWEINSEAVRYYTNIFQFEDGTPLKLEYQEEYITNASVLIALKKLKDYRQSLRKVQKGLMSSLWRDLLSFNDVLPKIHSQGHTMEVAEQVFSRKFKEFLNGVEKGFNYDSLISKKFKNQHAKIMTDAMLELLNNMFAGQESKPTKTQVADAYNAFLNGGVEISNEDTGEIYDPTDKKRFKPLSESSIIRYLSMWENIIGTYAKRSGDRQKLIGAFIPHHSLDAVKEAGIMVSVDDRQPPFLYKKGERLWFYMGIDLGSEVWTTWVWGESKEGLILELECESSLNASFKDTFLKNGAMFDRVRIEANNARGKKIERYFGKLRYEFEKDKKGWLGRPFARKESNQKGAEKEIILPRKEIVNNALRDIETWNNMEHSVYKGKSRWQVFMEMQSEKTQPTNWRAILPYLGFVTKTSCKAGIVRFRNSEYLLGLEGEICTGEDLIRLMRYVEGKSFEVYWLDDNEREVLKAMIYYEDMMLCELIPKPTYSRSYHELDDTGKINRQIMSAYENTINSFMRERKNEIDRLNVIDRRSKVLNTNFKIRGLEGYTPREEPAKVIETEAEETTAYEPRKERLVKSLQDNF